MSEACLALDTPVVSGNVSLYNESRGKDIFPTPVIGAVGVVEDERYVTPSCFRQTGSVVILIGTDDDALDGSLFWQQQAGQAAGDAPRFDLDEEVRVQRLVHMLIRKRLVRSAHDVSEGGLAVALAEMCIDGGMGLQVQVAEARYDAHRRLGWLFSEAQSRICLEVRAEDVERVLQEAEGLGVPAVVLGVTGGSTLTVRDERGPWLEVSVAELKDVYRKTLQEAMDRPVSQAG
jgi:phosphoribosylformylglycinamidine synthase subunit PurL